MRTVSERQHHHAALLKGQRQLVQAGAEQVRRLRLMLRQTHLHSTEVFKEALPEIAEAVWNEGGSSPQTWIKLFQQHQKVSGKEPPNTGATRDASLVALDFGVMSGYGLLSKKRRED